jgi:hypothetical protein
MFFATSLERRTLVRKDDGAVLSDTANKQAGGIVETARALKQKVTSLTRVLLTFSFK